MEQHGAKLLAASIKGSQLRWLGHLMDVLWCMYQVTNLELAGGIIYIMWHGTKWGSQTEELKSIVGDRGVPCLACRPNDPVPDEQKIMAE